MDRIGTCRGKLRPTIPLWTNYFL